MGAERRFNYRISVKQINIKILVFLTLVVGTALILRPLQITLRDNMVAARDNFIHATEESTGLRLHFSSMGPSIFGTLDIRNILLLREDDSVFLSMSRMRFSFSLFDLIRGNTLGAFRNVTIDNPLLNLDFEKDAGLLERISGRDPAAAPAQEYFAFINGQESTYTVQQSIRNAMSLLPGTLSVRIRNGEWEFADSPGALKFQNVSFDASIRDNRLALQGRWNMEASLNGGSEAVPFVTPDFFQAVVAARFNAEYFTDTGQGSASVTIQSAYTDFFRLHPLSVNFSLSGQRLEIRKAYDRSPATFSLVYDIERSRLQGRFEGENFSPSSMLMLTGALRDFNPVLDIRISGSAGFERENSDPLQYFVNLASTGPTAQPRSTTMSANRRFDAATGGRGNELLNQTSLTVNVAGNPSHVRVNNFDVISPFGRLRFSGGAGINAGGLLPFAPYGVLSLTNARLYGNSGLTGDIRIESHGYDVGFFSGNLRTPGTALSALDLSLSMEQRGFGFILSALSRSSEDDPDLLPRTLTLEGSMDNYPQRLRANLRLDSFPVEGILSFIEPFTRLSPAITPARFLTGDMLLSTQVFFTTDFDNVLYSVPRILLKRESDNSIMAAASISGTNRGMELISSHVSWEGGTAEFSGFLNHANPNNISFSLGAIVQNLAYSFDGHIHDMRNIGIRGSHGFEASLVAWETGLLTGHAQAADFPFPSGSGFASLSFLVSLFYESPSYWRAGIERLEVRGLTTPASSQAFLSLSGAANESGLTIPNLLFDDGRGPLRGNINLDWAAGFEYSDFSVNMAGQNYLEHYMLRGSRRGGSLELSLVGQGMQFARFSDHDAVVDGNLALSWESPESFSADAVVSAFFQNQNGITRASANISVDNDMFLSEQIHISHSGLEFTIPFISIDRTSSLAETEAWGSGFLGAIPVGISLHGNANFNQSDTWIDLLRDFRYMDASLTVTHARYDNIMAEEPFTLALNVNQRESGQVIDIHGGPRDMLRFRYISDDGDAGIFFAALSAPSPVRGTLVGSMDSGRIDARTTDLYVDMGSLWRFIPPEVDFIAFPAGIVTGQIAISGTLEEPQFHGTARANSLQIMIPDFFTVPIRPVPMDITLTGTEMTFGPVQATVGQGGGMASGWFMFDGWIPNIFNIDINVPDEHPIPYDLNIYGVMASGMTSGNLLLAMENFVFSVTGDLTAHNTAISVDADVLMAAQYNEAPEDELVSIVVDLSINAGRRVEFFWPSVNLPVIQALADMGTGIRITADTALQTYSIVGDVRLRGGEFFYFERNFYIREGVLVFRENEASFDPHISARAEIRERAATGPVTISMIVDHAPLMSFSPRFVSSPSISQLEIYSILGQMPQGGAEGEQPNMMAASLALDSLAQFTVMRRLEREVRDFFGLDMFSMRTQVFQNMLLQATDGDRGMFDRPYRLVNYFDNSTIFMGRFFQADIFGEAMINFRYDETRPNFGGLIVAPEFALEMRNPLFDIRLNIAPYSPANMFIDDVSLSLIWRRTF